MSSFQAREESNALVVALDDPASLNDFRSNAFRDALYDAVQQHGDPRVAIDLGRVDYLSSTGVAILVGLKRRLDARQGRFVLFGLQPPVHDLLQSMKLTRYFTIAAAESDALALLRPASSA
jgi:anti-anti-sigma factor